MSDSDTLASENFNPPSNLTVAVGVVGGEAAELLEPGLLASSLMLLSGLAQLPSWHPDFGTSCVSPFRTFNRSSEHKKHNRNYAFPRKFHSYSTEKDINSNAHISLKLFWANILKGVANS